MMSSEWMTGLSQAGVDVKQAMDRFSSNEALYIRFLGKFLQDSNFDKILVDASNKDYDAMLAHAHAMKGVSGNLGLTPLYETLCVMVAQLRSQNTKNLNELLLQLEPNYRNICKAIEKVAENQ